MGMKRRIRQCDVDVQRLWAGGVACKARLWQRERRLWREPKVFTINQNQRSRSIRIGVHGAPEYADYAVMAYLSGKKRDFVVRFPRHRFTHVNAFFDSREPEQVVELEVPQSSRKFVREQALAECLTVRLIRVKLESGEEEVLGTSLVDAHRYPGAEFKAVYGWRWNEETYFDRLKNIFEVERFSGLSVSSIKQDFYRMIFLMTLESVLAKPAQEALADASRARETKYVAQVNRVVSYVGLLDRVVELLCDHQANTAELLAELHHLFQTNARRPRVGRKSARPQRGYARKL